MSSSLLNSNNKVQSTSAANSNNSSRPLCRYFASNICFKGENCEFNHDRNARPDMICRYYLQGACGYGSRCRYDHVKSNRQQQNATVDIPTTEKISKSIPQLKPAVMDGDNQSTTPKIFTKLSANSKPFVPSTIPKSNPWNRQPTSPLDNFHQNMAQGLELIGGPEDNGEGCSSSKSAFGTNWDWPIQMATTKATQNTEEFLKIAAQIPICPYFEVGLCPNENLCRFVHGNQCEMCGLNVLHPHDENQRKVHHRECLAEHEKRMEEAFAVAKSAEMECGICMEVVVEKGLRFGILQNCSHCFCLECIRKWRKHEQRALDLNEQHIEVKTKRSCPECRVLSDYVIPSKLWIDDKSEKDRLIKMFHENTKKIQCKYVQGSDMDNCPFGNKCFYKHQLPDGTIAEGKSPIQMRRRRRPNFTLGDHTSFFFLYPTSDSEYEDDNSDHDSDDINEILFGSFSFYDA